MILWTPVFSLVIIFSIWINIFCCVSLPGFSGWVVSDSVTPWTAARPSLSFTRLLKLISIESVMPSSHLILCHPLLFPPSIFPCITVFSGESVKIIGASASVLPMNTQDWSPLRWTDWISLKSRGLFKSLLHHHSSKASILRRSAFFMVQLSHPHMTAGKTVALTVWTYCPLPSKPMTDPGDASKDKKNCAWGRELVFSEDLGWATPVGLRCL